MPQRVLDKKNLFVEYFDKNIGLYIRSGVYKDGKDTGIDPFMRSFPNLIDVGIMGSCIHGHTGLCAKAGVQCYQNGLSIQEPNMTLSDYKKIIDESIGKVFQVALGGRGDPDQHEYFEEILEYTKESGIVPNYTTSGLGITEEVVDLTKEFCGAVAVSWYRNDYTTKAIQMFLDKDVTTNIHYVLSNSSIDEAIDRLKNKTFPDVNAIVFLLHKPVGLGQQNEVLQVDDPRVKEFFEIVDGFDLPWGIGFDSCTVPGLLNFTKNIDRNSMDTCEAARFSMYITSDMKALPCSFDNQSLRWAYDISNDSIQNAWDSNIFNNFRNHFHNSCKGCSDKNECLGGCPIVNEIVLCKRIEREHCND